jgi:hypothetical protein
MGEPQVWPEVLREHDCVVLLEDGTQLPEAQL